MKFRSVSEAGVVRWSRPRRLDFFDRLPTAPVADSELLHVSHYCPVVVLAGPDGPRVALLLDPALSRSDPIGKDGRWRLPYCPMALRCLPFWPGSNPSDVEIALDIALQHPEAGMPLHDEAGVPSDAFAAVVSLIERLSAGMERLSAAATLLVAGDLLVPLTIEGADGAAPVETGYLTVDPDRLAAMTALRAASFSADHCLPIELATACLFSQRLLRPRVKLLKAPGGKPQRAPDAAAMDGLALEAPTSVDTSPLFSFELFARLEAQAHVAA